MDHPHKKTAYRQSEAKVKKQDGKLVISDPVRAAEKRLAEMQGWSRWSAAKAGQEIESRVKSLADVKEVLAEMAEMLVHLRDQLSTDA